MARPKGIVLPVDKKRVDICVKVLPDVKKKLVKLGRGSARKILESHFEHDFEDKVNNELMRRGVE